MNSSGFRGLGSEPSAEPTEGAPPSSPLTGPDEHHTPGRGGAGWAWVRC